MKTFILMLAGAAMSLAWTGNEAPSGSHYNLNLIGHTDCLGGSFTDSQRHTIAVLLNYSNNEWNILDNKNRIWLQPAPEGESFQVIDGSACDGAIFQLPADVSSTYFAYARALGSPKDNPVATLTTCYVDTTTDPDTIICSTADNVLTLPRTTGKNATKFTDATDELLFVCVDGSDGSVPNGTCQKTELQPLFANPLYNYFWSFDNTGVRLVQIRLYPKIL